MGRGANKIQQILDYAWKMYSQVSKSICGNIELKGVSLVLKLRAMFKDS